MRDPNWEEQIGPGGGLIKMLGERFGALRVHAMLDHACDCILCRRPSEYIGAFEVKDTIELYGLCHRCADLPDCIEKVEANLKARAAARIN